MVQPHPAELSAAVLPAERGLVRDVRPQDLPVCFKPVELKRVCLSGSANLLLKTPTGCCSPSSPCPWEALSERLYPVPSPM